MTTNAVGSSPVLWALGVVLAVIFIDDLLSFIHVPNSIPRPGNQLNSSSVNEAMATELSLEELSALLQELDASSLPPESLWLCQEEEQLNTPGCTSQWFEASLPTTANGKNRQSECSDSADRTLEQGAAPRAKAAEAVGKLARPSALTARRQKAYQEKKKTERSQLRATSAKLTAKLNALLARKETLRGELQIGGQDRALDGWRRIALRQMKQRLDAEALNRQLWAQIGMRQTLVQDLASMLRMRLSTIDRMSGMTLIPQTPKAKVNLNGDDLRLLAMFSNEMGGLYGQIPEVFRPYEHLTGDSSSHKPRYFRRWDDETQSAYVDIVESTLISFGLQDAVDALPKSLAQVYAAECTPVVASLPDSDNTLAIKMSFTCKSAQQRTPGAQFQYLCATKRFESPGRVVFVWKAFTEALDKSLGFMESGWCIAQEQPTTCTATTESPETVVNYCTRLRVLHSSSTMSNENGRQPLEDYIEFVSQAAESDIRALAHTIEDVLVHDAATGRCRLESVS